MSNTTTLHASRRGECFHLHTPRGPLNVRLDGNANGPAIVFSNSHATDLSLWSAQAASLADRCNVIRYDQRGHGMTPVSSDEVTFDTLAQDVVAVLDALDVERALLVGVSMGAVTMLRCAALHPSRVAGVLACDGQWAAPSGARETWHARMRIAMDEGMAALVEPTVSRWFTAGSLAHATDGVLHARRMIGATSAAGYIAAARAMQSYDFRADYPHLRVPVRYVAGANDGALPAVMRQMSDATPDARYMTIPDAGHLPNLERPDAFNDVLRCFVAELT
ncbi:alpha/beta fold hydrolase [Caballeronia sp. LP006]|uniref:alpha/beta fold hydrolase n=1 Tax=Caballeronia sp. LP006 TaxID=3038552 RepID=UPI0028599B2A|nr:alpha/beta fold hydrolase [Caballeronia sp. LP006]MDR5832223.1 alpha/beta fold hydrolase [Caballeronia sp. LP006]